MGIVMSLYNQIVEPTPMTRSKREKIIHGMGFLRERIALKDAMRSSTVVEQGAYRDFIKSLGVPKDLNYKKQRVFLAAIMDAMYEKKRSKMML